MTETEIKHVAQIYSNKDVYVHEKGVGRIVGKITHIEFDPVTKDLHVDMTLDSETRARMDKQELEMIPLGAVVLIDKN